MPPKSILKKTTLEVVPVEDTAVVDNIKMEESDIVHDDDKVALNAPDHYALPDAGLEVVSIVQDGGGDVAGGKKTQIKKKESIGASTSTSVSKPALKITKKKVSITEQSEESIMKDKTEVENGQIKREDKKEDKKEDKGKEVLVDVGKALKASKKSSKKQDITEIFNDDDVDYRYIITNYDFSKNKTLPKITKYEKALIVGKRAKQIEEGANPNVKVLPGQTSIDIAEEELRQRKIPFIIKRPIGNKFEYWKPIDMEVIMD